MRRLLLAGLGLALGCLAASAQAQEVLWRPVSPRPAAAGPGDPPAPSSAAPAPVVSLRPPTPLHPAPGTDPQLRPVAFSQATPADPAPVFRAKAGGDVRQPMPAGPVLEGGLVGAPGPKSGAAEPLPQPKEPGVPVAPKDAATTDPWGEIRPYGGFVPLPEAGAGPAAGPPGGPLDCGDGACCPDGCPAECCPEGCCCPDGRCYLPRVYFSGEYLLWRVRSAPLPPLVTTTGNLTAAQLLALAGANPAFRPGALGQPGTSTLFGGSDLDLNNFSGGRFTLGVGIAQAVGFEATFFFLGKNTEGFSANSPGTVGIFRPFIDVTAGGQSAEFVSFPGLLSGTVNVNYNTRMWGTEANLRYPLLCGCNSKLDLLAGFRFIDLEESLNINESITFLVSNAALGVAAGDNIQVHDGFGTINHFYGGQVGADFEYRMGRWLFGVTPKVALGNMHEVVNISGQTVFRPAAGGVTTVNGGLLAAPTNIGHQTGDRFAVVPEIGLKIGYQVTDHMKVFAGYDFLYMSSVVRPADQVDLRVNTTQIPRLVGAMPALVGPARPAVLFNRTDFWAQGLNVGLEFNY